MDIKDDADLNKCLKKIENPVLLQTREMNYDQPSDTRTMGEEGGVEIYFTCIYLLLFFFFKLKA